MPEKTYRNTADHRSLRTRLPTFALCFLCALGGVVSSASAEEDVSWFAPRKIGSSDPEANGEFGWSVAASAEIVVVGSQHQETAAVLERIDGQWQGTAELTSDVAGGDFGYALAVEGETALVGAPALLTFKNDSRIHVFDRQQDGSWEETQILNPNDQPDEFGISVGISGGTLIVGAWRDSDAASRAGAVYVYDRNPANSWDFVEKLTAPDAGIDDGFGYSVDIDGDTIVVGAWQDDERGNNSGSAYVFERDELGLWEFAAHLVPPDGDKEYRFGQSVTVFETSIAVGSRDDEIKDEAGAVHLYEKGPIGDWLLSDKLLAGDGGRADLYGQSVSMSDGVLVVGAGSDDDLGFDGGSAYVYELGDEPGGWIETAKLLPANGFVSDNFGAAVAAGIDTVVAGARFDDALGTNAGAVHIFEPTIVDPQAELSGDCPGLLTLSISGMTPRSFGALLRSTEIGADALTDRCVGTVSGLSNPKGTIFEQLDQTGTAMRTVEVGPELCGNYIQMLDIASCAMSPVVQVPQ